ncbi:MAG: alcohol dehydrogenase catalytic domain-containing protein [Sphaerochaeta sp.]|nr:alcohol dehydrogenase catalytic domain-containing protein [Sphaerochaeta sp.]
MKAIVKTGPQRGAELREVARPIPGPDEVLIDVKAAAICGTDIHYYEWNAAAKNFSAKFGLTFPFTLGHEVCGDVIEVGSDVRTVSVGQKVSVETHIPCGKCYQCHTGESHNCQDMKVYGTSYSGCFSEYALVPESVIFPIPDSISYKEGSLFEPAGVAMRAVEESGLKPGDTVVIFGSGAIGLLAMQIFKASGAGKVIAVDIDDYKLDLAKRYADVTINSMIEDHVKIIGQHTSLHGGADIVIELSGSQKVYETMFDCLRLEGHVVTVGHPAGDVTINITRNVNTKGATIKGVFGRRIWDTWYKLLSLVENKRIDILDVVTHEYTFEQFEEAFAQTKNAGKILFLKK